MLLECLIQIRRVEMQFVLVVVVAVANSRCVYFCTTAVLIPNRP